MQREGRTGTDHVKTRGTAAVAEQRAGRDRAGGGGDLRVRHAQEHRIRRGVGRIPPTQGAVDAQRRGAEGVDQQAAQAARADHADVTQRAGA
jgi:hypothetical protein